jgi:hypothetical protein
MTPQGCDVARTLPGFLSRPGIFASDDGGGSGNSGDTGKVDKDIPMDDDEDEE